MFRDKEQFDFSYYGVKFNVENRGMVIRYDRGLLDDEITIEPTNNASMIAKIIRVVHYEREGETYKQRFEITGLNRGKRYIMSGCMPVAEIERITEDEYRFHINAFYSSEIDSEYITVGKSEGDIEFFDGNSKIGRITCQGDEIRADYNRAALSFVHLLILPVMYLVFMPSERSIIDSEMELLFKKANERAEQYIAFVNKLRLKDLMRDVHQPDDQTDMVMSPRVNLMAAVSCYWPRHLMLAAEIETFREQLIGMWTPDSILEEDKYIQNEDITDVSIMGKRRPYLD